MGLQTCAIPYKIKWSPLESAGVHRSPSEFTGVRRSPPESIRVHWSPAESAGLQRTPVCDILVTNWSLLESSGVRRSPLAVNGVLRTPQEYVGECKVLLFFGYLKFLKNLLSIIFPRPKRKTMQNNASFRVSSNNHIIQKICLFIKFAKHVKE